jgi:hypothetical protein
LLSIDDVGMLVDVVITDPTRFDLVSQGIFSYRVVVTISSNEGWSLSQSIFDGHVSFSNCRGFWMFTPTSKRFFSSMCQYGVRNKGSGSLLLPNL